MEKESSPSADQSYLILPSEKVKRSLERKEVSSGIQKTPRPNKNAKASVESYVISELVGKLTTIAHKLEEEVESNELEFVLFFCPFPTICSKLNP